MGMDMNNARALRRAQAGTTEPAWVKWTLIGLALVFVFLFLVLPLAAVWVRSWRPFKNPTPGARFASRC
jgi:sulfate transport system permease protein